MKKTIICLFVLLMLTGCGNQKKTAVPITKNISFDLNVGYYNENYLCHGRLDSDGALTLTVNEPSELSGLTVNLNRESVRVSYKGLTYTPSENGTPLNGVYKTVYGVLSDISDIKSITGENGKNYALNGKLNGKEYVFTFSPTGYPLDFKLLSEAFEAEFSNVTPISDG